MSQIEYFNPSDFLRYTKIFVNGAPIGYTHYPDKIVNELRSIRRTCGFSSETCISYNEKYGEIKILTDPGRMTRGLVVLKDGQPIITEQQLDSLLNEQVSKFRFKESEIIQS